MNTNPYILFAQVEAIDPNPSPGPGEDKGSNFIGSEVSIILGVALVLAVLLMIWAFFIRKRPKRARGELVSHRSSGSSKESHGTSGRRKRRKRRPEHPDNWGRNPTLGETGGLPPLRPQDPETSSSEPHSPPAT